MYKKVILERGNDTDNAKVHTQRPRTHSFEYDNFFNINLHTAQVKSIKPTQHITSNQPLIDRLAFVKAHTVND